VSSTAADIVLTHSGRLQSNNVSQRAHVYYTNRHGTRHIKRRSADTHVSRLNCRCPRRSVAASWGCCCHHHPGRWWPTPAGNDPRKLGRRRLRSRVILEAEQVSDSAARCTTAVGWLVWRHRRLAGRSSPLELPHNRAAVLRRLQGHAVDSWKIFAQKLNCQNTTLLSFYHYTIHIFYPHQALKILIHCVTNHIKYLISTNNKPIGLVL